MENLYKRIIGGWRKAGGGWRKAQARGGWGPQVVRACPVPKEPGHYIADRGNTHTHTATQQHSGNTIETLKNVLKSYSSSLVPPQFAGRSVYLKAVPPQKVPGGHAQNLPQLVESGRFGSQLVPN